MFNKNLWLGISIGLFIVISIIGFTYFKGLSLLETPPAASTTIASDDEPSSDIQTLEANTDLHSVTPQPTIKPTSKPTIKPTIKPSIAPSPTPTPKPVVDYYIHSHSQILVPDEITTTEYVENKIYPRMRLEVDMGMNNASPDGIVNYKIIEDGVVRESGDHKIIVPNSTFDDVYYAKSWEPGSHTVRFVYNENRAVIESNYDNNEYIFTFRIIAEKEPPTFTIDGPYLIDGQTCMRWINPEDNKSTYTDVWAKWKIDDGAWSQHWSGTQYGCISGISGSSHTYYVHAEDFRGNVKEGSKTFNLF